MVVECNSVDDLIAVLHEGNRNRRIGSHEMNKDSSRSHSLLNLYIIS
jgi:kinesin family protein 12